ncbi:MAG TPA: NUDIX domain-containing protein [Candidatus Saccharimonadales bacterium]|nr:NUDIX domain-containing protein [Candidatus Saccharimonadales bacterium]
MKNLKCGIDCKGVSALALIHDGNGNILLQQRGKQARDEQGKWDFCGGAVEFGQSIVVTIKRELMEELSTEPISMQLLTAYDAHRNINGSRTNWVAIVYAVKVNPASVKIGEPHKIDRIDWFTSANLPSPRHSQFDKSYSVARSLNIIK